MKTPTASSNQAVAVPEEASKCPPDTDFRQQRLPAWQPVMSPPYVVGCFVVTGIIFVIIGVLVVVASDSVVLVDVRYDTIQSCPYSARNNPTANQLMLRNGSYLNPMDQYWACNTTVVFEIPKPMAEVYMYYKLENFYQNHRKFAKSFSSSQLVGLATNTIDSTNCDPYYNPKMLFSNSSMPLQGVLASSVYSPCGLVPWSKFNDTFALSLLSANSSSTLLCVTGGYQMDGSTTDPAQIPGNLCTNFGIAWDSDIKVKFKAPAPDPTTYTTNGFPLVTNTTSVWSYSDYWIYSKFGWYVGEPGHRIPNQEDPDLMNWMRISSLPAFRKLLRRFTAPLPAGTYMMTIFQRFDVSGFSGKKAFQLSTSSWIGGQNYVLGGLYIAVGALVLILGIAFGVKYMFSPARIFTL